MIVLSLSPLLHRAFNFFSYANMRWYFGLVLLFSYIFVDQFEIMLSLSKARKLIISALGLICMAAYSYKQVDVISKVGFRITTSIIEFLPVIFTFLFLILLFILKGKRKVRIFSILVIMSILSNTVVYAKRTAELKKLVSDDIVDKVSYDVSLDKISKLTKDSFDRVENYSSFAFNMSDIYNYPSVSVYYSLENKNLSEFNLRYKNSQATPINRMRGLDSRAILESIFSVKYYYGDAKIPYGFEKKASSEVKNTSEKDRSINDGQFEKNDDEKIFVNKNYLPFGFTYDTYIDEGRLEGMDTLDRQEVLMKSGIIRGEIPKNFSIEKLDESKLSEISLKETGVDFRKIDENSWYRYKENLRDLEAQYSGEYKNSSQNNLSAYEKSILDGKRFEVIKIEDELEKGAEKIDKKSKIKVKKDENIAFLYDLKYPAEVYLRIKDSAAFKPMENVYVGSEKNIAKIDIIRPESNWYSGEEEVVYNLGYFEAGKHSFKIIPSADGEIDLGKLSLDARSLSSLETDTKFLKEEHLKNIKLGVDEFSGSIDLSSDKLMFISISYSDGWKAFVDGREEKIYNSNGFMALPLKKGSHKVEFKYSRPYQKLGVGVSILGILLFIIFVVIRRKRKHLG